MSRNVGFRLRQYADAVGHQSIYGCSLPNCPEMLAASDGHVMVAVERWAAYDEADFMLPPDKQEAFREAHARVARWRSIHCVMPQDGSQPCRACRGTGMHTLVHECESCNGFGCGVCHDGSLYDHKNGACRFCAGRGEIPFRDQAFETPCGPMTAQYAALLHWLPQCEVGIVPVYAAGGISSWRFSVSHLIPFRFRWWATDDLGFPAHGLGIMAMAHDESGGPSVLLEKSQRMNEEMLR